MPTGITLPPLAVIGLQVQDRGVSCGTQQSFLIGARNPDPVLQLTKATAEPQPELFVVQAQVTVGTDIHPAVRFKRNGQLD